ncbi:MAG: sigma-54 interaction domain-containing protein, partial [Mailhella sp.]
SINTEILELLHSGIALFNRDARLVYANPAYLEMYHLDKNSYVGIRATDLFLTARQGILEVLRTGKSVSCTSVSVEGFYGVTYRYPLKDKKGQTVGCMTENLSVGMDKQRIHELQKIIFEVQNIDELSTMAVQKKSQSIATFDTLIGESASIRMLKTKGLRFAQHDEPILILGENGTGKDIVAQAIHSASSRKEKNFVAVNCAALPHDLMESELFGYSGGAFTGARSAGKKGKFELAEGGTIFLDEIGELPLALQAKLLRVLENHEIQKLGEERPSYVDFRLLSATNRDLEKLVEQGKFREDLFFRINLFEVLVPPLRERLADIPLLSYSFIHELLGPERCQSVRISHEVMALLTTHQWRGNVRELRNIITYSLYSMTPGEHTLCVHHLPERFFTPRDNEFVMNSMTAEISQPMEQSMKEQNGVEDTGIRASRRYAEAESIRKALLQSGGNKVQAAKLLGMARSNLYKKMADLGMDIHGRQGKFRRED